VKNKETSKAVTARFPLRDYLQLQEEAERRGTTIAEIIRASWSDYQQQRQVQQHLTRLEMRQRKVNFEMLCAVIGLKIEERDQALAQLQRIGVKW
jgi:hypothetical protein